MSYFDFEGYLTPSKVEAAGVETIYLTLAELA